MVNKVRVTIAGAPYAIATTDTENYITTLAKKLDDDITKLLDNNGYLSVTKAAVFCAMVYLDEYRKSAGSAENMRSQIQDYISDAAKAKLAADKVKAENATLKRENAALREQLATLQQKLVVNTTGVLFDLLGKCGDRTAITAAGDYLSTALYTLLRHFYRRGGGNEDFFATDAVDFDAGVVDAAMLRSRAAYLRALSAAEKLPELTSDDLTAAPGLGQSTAQVVHNVDELAGRQ